MNIKRCLVSFPLGLLLMLVGCSNGAEQQQAAVQDVTTERDIEDLRDFLIGFFLCVS